MSVYDQDARIIEDAIAVFTGADPDRSIYSYSRSEIEVDTRRREVYSYGRHFPLFRFVPRALNGWRDLFLINGDDSGFRNSGGGWHSSRTPDHQARSRAFIRETGAFNVVIPFSALTGAGIELDSVRIVDVRPDEEWNETVTVRSLEEMPRHARIVHFTREHSSPRLEDLPDTYYHSRKQWRMPTSEELAAGIANESAYLPRLPDEDGLFRWTTNHTRPKEPNPDGTYSYERRVHRLGDSLISARREGRRARFLSSFDTNESPPLYFLAQVPRGAGDTVAMALEALAPRAVHAAIARGREVKRQGDIFFIDTELTREELEARGAVFARFTQWSRDARARKGEVNYSAPQTAAARRREDRYARKLFQERRADTLARAGAVSERPTARAETRAAWRALEARHRFERREAAAAGAPFDSPLSVACSVCEAPIGAECSRVDLGAEYLTARVESERLASGLHIPRVRSSLEQRQATEISNLRHKGPGIGRRYNGAPSSEQGARKRARREHLAAEARVNEARETLQRKLAAPFRYLPARELYSYTQKGAVMQARERHAQRITAARENLRRELERLELARNARARARDRYRDSLGTGGKVSIVLWREARQKAAAKYRPDDFAPDRISARRERARRALAIYGTAHTATEVARVRGAVYARGVIRHRRDLETGRSWDSRDSDHAAITLAPERWYLAVRNTVPRQRRAQ